MRGVASWFEVNCKRPRTLVNIVMFFQIFVIGLSGSQSWVIDGELSKVEVEIHLFQLRDGQAQRRRMVTACLKADFVAVAIFGGRNPIGFAESVTSCRG